MNDSISVDMFRKLKTIVHETQTTTFIFSEKNDLILNRTKQ